MPFVPLNSAKYGAFKKSRGPPHLDAMPGGFAHRQEVGHNVGHQVRTHFDRSVEVILKQTAR